LANRRAAWLTGSIVYVLSAQYFVGEVVAASAWQDPAYDWRANYISDLGVVTCGEVCSPLHAVMNTSFVLLGVLVALGSVLLRGHLASGLARNLFVTLMVTSGIGDVLVGLFPGSVEVDATGADLLHVVGAVLAIVGGNTGIVVAGIALRRAGAHPKIATYSIASGLVGLSAFALFGLGVDLGLGIGAMERLAAYPITLWMIVVGTVSLIRSRAPVGR